VIILPALAIKRLVENGSAELWSPALDGSLDLTPEQAIADADALFGLPQPRLDVIHAVRRRSNGQSITRAKATAVRPAALQTLTYAEALAAGFRTRDDFYDWWRAKHGTGPRMDTVPCWVATYENVADDVPYLLGRPVPGKQGDYVTNPRQAIDDLEAVDAEEWAKRAGFGWQNELVLKRESWKQQRRKNRRR
jgi:hypothetical protein